ncbi:flagellar hook assembly protein FlgD [Legionella micdadei]|uniref:Basal-body rod modification protein FlgD n=1 Tax=Legionella micdadei TaxID=451 RepID=A0A098GJF5_LEGMI|nr:flagellar hook capping FlgD N-terminal domain-containing protein [Legionella micdadei]ARG96957.1 hypothetical protein B6N58_04320 [Legionella micdadei]ARH00788.1 hypothetical protein B6V88_10380 [Legionella micdadei]KTD26667.1 flagellar basal body rod modification protein [Legionella micdadei]NSL19472.1 flagellar hook capping protein [Legionella micdadei]CEG61636.1 putative flagellar hook capping protein [Legionella micdadei]
MTNAISPTQEMSIDQADYLKLFMQELTYQDPLKPIDNKEFMAQMAQFSALQEAQTTNQLLESLAESNKSLMLLGKNVTLRNSDLDGVVNKIEFSPNSPPWVHVLLTNGDNPRVQLTDITIVRNSANQ